MTKLTRFVDESRPVTLDVTGLADGRGREVAAMTGPGRFGGKFLRIFRMLTVVILIATTADPQPALAYGALIRLVMKVMQELSEHGSAAVSKAASKTSGKTSAEIAEVIVVRATTRAIAPRVESITEFFKDSLRMQPARDEREYARLTIPASVDMRRWAAPVQDQGDEGLCTAFAIAGAIEIAIGQQYFGRVKLSERHIWSFYRWPNLYAAVVALDGKPIISDSAWPYNRRRPVVTWTDQSASFRGAQSVQQLETVAGAIRALAGNKPLIFGTEVTANFERRFVNRGSGRGVIPLKSGSGREPVTGAHAMTVVGYKMDNQVAGGGYFIVRNSWGKDWGAGGYGYLPFGWCSQYHCYAYTLDDVQWNNGARFVATARDGAT